MREDFKSLLTPITIRGKVFRNRILSAPMIYGGVVIFPENRDRLYNLVEGRAKGGAAAVASGAIGLNVEEGVLNYCFEYYDPEVYSGKQFDGFSGYVERIHRHGALAFAEIMHEGAIADRVREGYYPWGPSEYLRKDGERVRPFDEEMMHKVCEDYRKMAGFLKACGYDGLIIQGGHGNLIQQFISPLYNKRTDDYGGSIENRSRFPKRILESVRRGGGEDFLISMRMSAEDYGIPGGMTIDDVVGFAREIDGVCDIFELMNGTKLEGWTRRGFASPYDHDWPNADYAARVKAAVKQSVVAVNGAIDDEYAAEAVVREGKADLVVMARALIADPELPNKLVTGERIRHCLRCYNCSTGEPEEETDLTFPEKGFTASMIYGLVNPTTKGNCAVNPASAKDVNTQMAATPKKILIVGGGLAGMNAAIYCKKHGNDPYICEKSGELGGLLLTARPDSEKARDDRYRRDLEAEIRELGIPVLLNTEVTAQLLAEQKPDAVICAIGAALNKPFRLPGAEKALDVVTAFRHPERIGERVAVIGGGLSGCEIALECAARGKKVTVLEKNQRMIPDIFCYRRAALLGNMKLRGIDVLLNFRCTEIGDGSVTAIDQEHSHVVTTPANDVRTIPVDTVIYALGLTSRREEAEALKKAAEALQIRYIEIGDVVRPAHTHTATEEAYQAALALL